MLKLLDRKRRKRKMPLLKSPDRKWRKWKMPLLKSPDRKRRQRKMQVPAQRCSQFQTFVQKYSQPLPFVQSHSQGQGFCQTTLQGPCWCCSHWMTVQIFPQCQHSVQKCSLQHSWLEQQWRSSQTARQQAEAVQTATLTWRHLQPDCHQTRMMRPHLSGRRWRRSAGWCLHPFRMWTQSLLCCRK